MAGKAESRRSGRLDQSSLERALDEVYKDQQGEETRADASVVICGHENASGVDPNFAGKLHDKLAETAQNAEQSGLRAPCTTQMLSAKELAALYSEDEDDETKVVLDTRSHGFMDQVDSKLVTELNKKLADEAQQAAPPKPSSDVPNRGFTADLNAALERKLGGQANDGDALAAALGQKLQFATSSNEVDQSGLRAPQCTVKLSAETLAGLDDDEDAADPAMLIASAHGAIEQIDSKLVLELQQKLAAKEAADAAAAALGPESSSSRALPNTVKLTANVLPDEDTEASGNGATPLASGLRAPQCTVKLTQDMLANLGDDEDVVADDARGNAPGSAVNPPAPAEEHGGLRAPQPTQLITADMLANLGDDDEIEASPGQGAGVNPNEAKPNKGVGVSGGAGEFDPSFFDSLQRKLESGGGRDEPSVVKKNSLQYASMDALEAGLQKAFGAAAIGPDDKQFTSGSQAPSCTANVADQMAMLDDEEDMPTLDRGGDIQRRGADGADLDESTAIPSGLKAPQTTCMLSPEQLAALAAEDEDLPVQESQRSAAPAQATTMSKELADRAQSLSTVIQSMREEPDGPDLLDKHKTMTSTCKLRLAWLTKDEVRKENNQLRKEIAALRSEIEEHRKEACLARKAHPSL